MNEALESIPLLRLLPQTAREKLCAKFRTARYEFGEIIVKEGDLCEDYYLLVKGKARVIKTCEGHQEIAMHSLLPGEGFGEMGLLYGGRRQTSVRASEKVELLTISGTDFRELLAAAPAVREYIEIQLQHRRLVNFLRELSSLRELSPSAARDLVEQMQPEMVKAGQTIILEGDDPGPMYIVESGHVRIYRLREGEEKDLAYLRPGDYFGEMSFFRGVPRTACAQAATDCRLLLLDMPALEMLRARHPDFNEGVRRRIAQYSGDQDVRMPLDFCRAVTLPAHPRETTASAPEFELSARRPHTRRGRNRVAFVQQIDETDCGAAALAGICRYFGRDVSLAHIRELACVSPEGAGLNDLCRTATELGLAARPVKKSVADLDQLPLPAIVHWQSQHWVVLTGVNNKTVNLVDPAMGMRKMQKAEFKERWTGYAALFDYTSEFDEAPETEATWHWISPYVLELKWSLIKVFLLTLLLSGLQMCIPHLTQTVVDDVLQSRAFDQLNLYIGVLGAALVFMLLITLAQRRVLSSAAAELDGTVLNFIIGKMLSLPLSYFTNRRDDDIRRRLSTARDIRYFVVNSGIVGLVAVTQLAAFVGMMCYYSGTMTVVFLAVAPIYLGLMYFSGKILRPAFDALHEAENRIQNLQNDLVSGIETIKAAGNERRFHPLIVARFTQLTNSENFSRFNISLYEGTVHAISFLSTIMFLWVGGRLVMLEKLSLGEFFAFQMLVAMSYFPIITMLGSWEDLQQSSILLNRLNDIIHGTPEQVGDADDGASVPTLAGAIELVDLTYRYGSSGDMPDTLQNISLTIPAGATVAITGRSGAGKSTLVKCIAALLEPTSGDIRYDQVSISEINPSDLRRHIGLVPQEAFVLAGSVLQNIGFGEETPDGDRVVWAARVANLHDLVMQLPQEYDTVIGESGVQLSSGQKQALAVARTVYRKPAIYIFDETTSVMDYETERMLWKRLFRVIEGRTTLIVTHRLNTIREADLIVVMDRGRIAEQGNHDALMKRRGLYYNWVVGQTA